MLGRQDDSCVSRQEDSAQQGHIQETHDLRVATDVKLAFAKVGEEV